MSEIDDDVPPPKRRRKGRSEHYRANNEGGYGNPPVKSQFGPGGAGGPGRRRGTTSLASAMRRMFASTVPAKINGEVMNMSMGDALAQNLRKHILSGNLKALELGLDLMGRYGPVEQKNELNMFDISVLSIEEKLALRKVLMTAEPVERREVFRALRQSKAWRESKAGDKPKPDKADPRKPGAEQPGAEQPGPEQPGRSKPKR